MHRSDTPPYAADIVASAPIGRQLVVSAGLFVTLLIGMSAIEEPMARQDQNGDVVRDPHTTSSTTSWTSFIPCESEPEPVG